MPFGLPCKPLAVPLHQQASKSHSHIVPVETLFCQVAEEHDQDACFPPDLQCSLMCDVTCDYANAYHCESLLGLKDVPNVEVWKKIRDLPQERSL